MNQMGPQTEEERFKMFEFLQQSQAAEEAARAQAADTRLMAGLGSAGNKIGAAIAGTQADTSFYDQMGASADSAVDDARRAQERKLQIAQYLQGRQDRSEDVQFKRDQAAKDRELEELRYADTKDFRNQQLDLSRSKIEASERAAAAKRAEDAAKKDAGLEVPGLGLANTKVDANTLKAATEGKAKFDRILGEMINLRKEYGTEYFNREAVNRGKQLSKDLLLTYKNLAKLGVLSKSDEAIVNAIIPDDPLGHDGPGDSILNNLTKLRDDIGTDYKTTLQMRLQNPDEAIAGVDSQMKRWKTEGQMGPGTAIADDDPNPIVQRQFSPSRNQTKVVRKDGTVEFFDGKIQ